jgi:flagellar biosynthesis anti-sigma factor FlgM
MRIDLQYGSQQVPESGRNSAQASSAAATPSTIEAEEDQAQLSGAHVQVQALTAQASQLPEVREERVQSLRNAVESGQYEADPEKVAGALLSHMVFGPAA